MSLDETTVGGTRTESDPKAGVLAIGVVLGGRYRVLEYVGHGGMGVVYRAHDLQLHADIALKVVAPDVDDDKMWLEALAAEVRLARLVTHPNVCRIHDLERSDAMWFVTMAFVDGETLENRLTRAGTFPPAIARRILYDVALGLAAIHAAGVVHRDLKPSNVLLDAASGRAIIADFGVAISMGRGADGVAGTPGFMAPEQAAGRAVDESADVYALGALARRMVGLDTSELDDFVTRCSAEEPTARPDLEVALRMLAPPRRPKRILAAVALALAGVATATAMVVTEPSPAEPPASAMTNGVRSIRIDAGALDEPERWLGDAIAARVRDELDDAWAVAVDPNGTTAVTGTLRRETTGRIVLEASIGGSGTITRAGSIEEVAAALASDVAARFVRHPSPAELAAVGAQDPEAWRAMRRAQRHGLMQRWHAARPFAEDAFRRDPGCAVCALVLALCFDRTDTRGLQAIQEAAALPGGAAHWRVAIDLAARSWKGSDADLPRDATRLIAMEMPDRDRRWMLMRVAASRYDAGETTEALALLERIAETWPHDASAPKYLAGHHLRSDAARSVPLALRWAARAVEHAPDDLTARAFLARANVRAGRLDEARLETARIDRADADLKRASSRDLFILHTTLGQPDLAEQDARRLLTGSAIERAQGARLLGALDLYWGRFAGGLDWIENAIRQYEAAGREALGDESRLDGAAEALALGDRARARGFVSPIAMRHPGAAATLAILDGRVADARKAVERAAAGPQRDALAIVVDVASGRDADALAHYRARGGDVAVEALAAIADLQSRTNDAALVDVLARLDAHPQAWRREVAVARARVGLGRAAAMAGDRERAAAAFREVLARWERAAPDSDAVRTARAELERLAVRP